MYAALQRNVLMNRLEQHNICCSSVSMQNFSDLYHLYDEGSTNKWTISFALIRHFIYSPIRAVESDDLINGLEGNDDLNGGAGNDTITGGLGEDTYLFESGNDAISGAGLGENDILRFANNFNWSDIEFSHGLFSALVISFKSSNDTLGVAP